MVTNIRKKGDVGEKKVGEFLKRRGFTIIEKNYQNNFGEIDIISKRGVFLHFIEVKSSFTHYSPEENMTPNKMRKIIKSATLYMINNRINEANVCFDLVSVNFRKKTIVMYPNINTDFN